MSIPLVLGSHGRTAAALVESAWSFAVAVAGGVVGLLACLAVEAMR